MDLERLYELQEKLDHHILENNNIEMSKEELLDNTILALLVEVGELANTTRCFKHWSKKGMMEKEVILDELADVWHFYLNIGNQGEITIDKENITPPLKKYKLNEVFNNIYHWATKIPSNTPIKTTALRPYTQLGAWLIILQHNLKFTDEEVESAYLVKHKENYKRQAEGY